MPMFKRITREVLERFLSEIKSSLDGLCDSLDEDVLCYLFMKLYEYVQCLSKFRMLGEKDLYNVNVTVKDIRSLINIDKSENWEYQNFLLNNLMKFRNAIGHSSFDEADHVLEFLSDSEVYTLFRELRLDEELISKLQRVEYLFSSKETLKAECREDCKRFIVLGRKKQATVGVVLASLYKKYPKSIVDDCFLSTIKNECFI